MLSEGAKDGVGGTAFEGGSVRGEQQKGRYLFSGAETICPDDELFFFRYFRVDGICPECDIGAGGDADLVLVYRVLM